MGLLASAGGANAFLDTLIEADRRFLKTAPGQWPVFVIVTTDKGELNRESRLDDYNKFMNDFLGARRQRARRDRGAAARWDRSPTSTLNLVENVGGLLCRHQYRHVAAGPGESHCRAPRRRSPEDGEPLRGGVHRRRQGAGAADGRASPSTREGVQLEMSPRRPF